MMLKKKKSLTYSYSWCGECGASLLWLLRLIRVLQFFFFQLLGTYGFFLETGANDDVRAYISIAACGVRPAGPPAALLCVVYRGFGWQECLKNGAASSESGSFGLGGNNGRQTGHGRGMRGNG